MILPIDFRVTEADNPAITWSNLAVKLRVDNLKNRQYHAKALHTMRTFTNGHLSTTVTFLADSQYTSLQRSLFSVPNVAVLERFHLLSYRRISSTDLKSQSNTKHVEPCETTAQESVYFQFI